MDITSIEIIIAIIGISVTGFLALLSFLFSIFVWQMKSIGRSLEEVTIDVKNLNEKMAKVTATTVRNQEDIQIIFKHIAEK